ncbi:MAG TPA: galactokinase family protein [Pyrinomonadaceae bacterium]|nr:galactokinase family protein [Pyrinomonadaceae bacterium]
MTGTKGERLRTAYEIVRGDARHLSDVTAFIETLSKLEGHPAPEARTLFDSRRELTVARAPGRLDVMGGIADYSGSVVLEMPIAEATLVALQKDDSRRLSVVSLIENETRVVSFEMPLADLERDGEPIEYDEARNYFRGDATPHWAAYVAGTFLVLMRELGTRFKNGARLLISSRVPDGKGVSSSAALEVGTMTAVAAAFGIEVEPRELALLCQRVENLVVGAPCGVMDQMTSACGEQNQLLALLCQPAELLGTISLPKGLAVWGIDSGVRHSVGGGDYGSVRIGAFMGYRIIADLSGLTVKQSGGNVVIDDPRWGGYLANLAPSEFEEKFASRLPEKLLGADFVERYGATTDMVTSIEPGITYPVRAPAAHAVHESYRVQKFAEVLRHQLEEPGNREEESLGELMYQSHASYSSCGLGSEGTDELVELVRRAGVSSGLYGAKITGGGSGGTVAVLGRSDAGAAVAQVARSFAEKTGHQPYIFSGSSPGSAVFGRLILRRT